VPRAPRECRAAGFVTLRAVDDGAARIGLLAVASGCTGRGIGGLLVGAAQSWCTKRGIVRLRVATQTSNLGAIRFYQSRGAVITGISHWMYR
jgi:dTDP-4-amino-4,6-dideoxy-D-galactose acyltransferase